MTTEYNNNFFKNKMKYLDFNFYNAPYVVSTISKLQELQEIVLGHEK